MAYATDDVRTGLEPLENDLIFHPFEKMPDTRKIGRFANPLMVF